MLMRKLININILFFFSFSVMANIINEQLIIEPINEDKKADIIKKDISPLEKSIFLVIDNSGSMKNNDPNFMVKKTIIEFIKQQKENVHIGVIIFDKDVKLSIPLTRTSIDNRKILLSSIDNINYDGKYTNIPAGIEPALYELKNNKLNDTKKSIVFITDGIIDTGDPEKDLEKTKWLHDYLAQDAADHNIKIFGIAFTENADFQLIQSLAQKTEGEYYRAKTVENLNDIFKNIDENINKIDKQENTINESALEKEIIVIQPSTSFNPSTTPTNTQINNIEDNTQALPHTNNTKQETHNIEKKANNYFIIFIITLLAIITIILLLLKNKRVKNHSVSQQFIQEAYIYDLKGNTDKEIHKLGSMPTMFGRTAGGNSKDELLNYIVIDQTTIGRRHALIEYKDHAYWLIDQGSINGTFVNGIQVVYKVRLKHGDRIKIYKCEFDFIIPEMEDNSSTVFSNTIMADTAVTNLIDKDKTKVINKDNDEKQEPEDKTNQYKVAKTITEENDKDK